MERLCESKSHNLHQIMKLDLGCGPVKREGYIGIDKYDYGHNIVRDVERGIPFNDNTFDEIYSSHFIEHITDWIFVFNEMWRVCKKGAQVILRYPRIEDNKVFHPLHKTFYSVHFFEQITSKRTDTKASKELEREGLKAKFDLVSIRLNEMKDQVVILKCIK